MYNDGFINGCYSFYDWNKRFRRRGTFRPAKLNVGRAAEAGIAIVLLAIVLDRITQSYGETLQERNSPIKKENK